MLITDLKINPRFERILPPLTDEEFLGLQNDIVKYKGRTDRDPLNDPIHVWSNGNVIIDGHNRYKILISNKMQTSNIKVHDEFENESSIIEWIYNNQKNRRNLTREQLVNIWSTWEMERAKEAEARLHLAKGQGIKGSSNLNEVKSDSIRTAAEVARKIGVSENTYRDMKYIVENGSREKIDRMNMGGKGNGVSKIADEIREGVPDGHRRCNCCGLIKPFSEFNKEGSGTYKTICKECHNKTRREYSKKLSEIKKEEALNDFNSRESLMMRQFGERPKYTLDMYISELKSNMNNTIGTMQLIINAHVGEFTDCESVIAINSLFETFINKITKLKERSTNGSNQEEEGTEQ